jgi:hypothetical protein
VNGGNELRAVAGVAAFDGVVEHDALAVVDDLGFVAELDRPSEPSFGDRASVRVLQADLAGRPVGSGSRQPLAGLGCDAAGGGQQFGEVVDRAV